MTFSEIKNRTKVSNFLILTGNVDLDLFLDDANDLVDDQEEMETPEEQ